jgi:hypothetical protein
VEKDASIAMSSYLGANIDVAGNMDGKLALSSRSGNINVFGNVAGIISYGNFENENPKELEGIVLYPGDSMVKHFVLKTTRWLTFTPINHTFQIQVRYEVDEKKHIDTLPFSVNIRAPIKSSIIGSIIGSCLGYIVSERTNFNQLTTQQFLVAIIRTIIFALIIIVAFARKSNVQQIVSIEDFWGGLFIGFLVGYSGDDFIKTILGESSKGVTK